MQSSSIDHAVGFAASREVQLHDLAKDLFLYRHDSEGVLRAHGVTPDEFHNNILPHPVFIAAAQEIAKQAKSGPHVAIRMAAGDAVRQQIPVIHSIVMDGGMATADRIKAAEYMARMADANPKESKNGVGTGTVLNIHIGPKQTVVEAG